MGSPFRLLVYGWRDIHHSFSVVNQHQLFSLLQFPDVALSHIDAPYPAKSWASAQVPPGWSPESQEALVGLPEGDFSACDMVYTMSYPFNALDHAAAPNVARFVVSEFGLLHSGFRGGPKGVREMSDRSAIVVTPSEWSRQKLISGGIAEGKIRVVPHGVLPDVFYPLPALERRALRQRLAIDDESFCFLNVGAMTWNKGLDLLLRAFAQVRLSAPQSILILKDQAPLYGISAQALVHQTMQRFSLPDPEGLMASIRLLSSQLTARQLAETYNCADCYVSPYRAEGFNMPVLEALACGVAVVVTEGGPTDDYVGTFAHRLAAQAVPVTQLPEALRQDLINDSSYYLEPDFDALVSSLCQAIEHRTRESELLRAARCQQAYRYSWQSVSGALVDALRSASARPSAEDR